MRRPVHARPATFLLQMTPLIDVVFLLLTYFLFTLSLGMLEGVLPSKLALGRNQGEMEPEVAPRQQVIVRLVQSGSHLQYFLDDWPVASFQALSDGLRRLTSDTLVVIDAAPTVNVAPVIRAYNLCLKLGLSRVVFPVTP